MTWFLLSRSQRSKARHLYALYSHNGMSMRDIVRKRIAHPWQWILGMILNALLGTAAGLLLIALVGYYLVFLVVWITK